MTARSVACLLLALAALAASGCGDEPAAQAEAQSVEAAPTKVETGKTVDTTFAHFTQPAGWKAEPFDGDPSEDLIRGVSLHPADVDPASAGDEPYDMIMMEQLPLDFGEVGGGEVTSRAQLRDRVDKFLATPSEFANGELDGAPAITIGVSTPSFSDGSGIGGGVDYFAMHDGRVYHVWGAGANVKKSAEIAKAMQVITGSWKWS